MEGRKERKNLHLPPCRFATLAKMYGVNLLLGITYSKKPSLTYAVTTVASADKGVQKQNHCTTPPVNVALRMS